jgi:hypothetical protein
MDLLIALAAALSLSVPGRSAATPSIASRGDVVVVVFSASAPSGVTDIYAAVSRDGGRAFAPPVRVNHVDGDARVNGEQPPRVALSDKQIIVVWTAKGAKGTRLLEARSSDGGATFAPAAVVPGTDAAGNRGWENLAGPFAVWLDHRELAQDDAAVAMHHHDSTSSAHATGSKPDGVAMAQKSKLYFASLDGSIAPHAVTGGVCYCCKTALAIGPSGAIFAAWRHVYPGNLRDIAFALSRDGGKTFATPIRVSEDKWMLEGCPDDGPAMAVDGRERIHLVWPTMIAGGANAAPTIGLFYATSDDGRTFTPRERIPTEGVAHHPQIAIAGDGLPVIAWDESDHGARHAVVSHRNSRPSARFSRQVLSGSEAAVYPVIAQTHDATVAAWTSGKGALSTIAIARLPAGASASW